jgi:hypothetical protein
MTTVPAKAMTARSMFMSEILRLWVRFFEHACQAFACRCRDRSRDEGTRA